MRTTMDIDANITGMNFEKSAIEEMINKIIFIEIDDNVVFEIDKNIPIKEDNEYGGYRFKLIAKLSNLRIPFSIDISTGDLITPRAIEYNYKTILENENISLYTYNYETIVAEKLETVLKRNTANSRMKDYYDLYYFATYKWNDIDITTLKTAISTTLLNLASDAEDSRNLLMQSQSANLSYIKDQPATFIGKFLNGSKQNDINNRMNQIRESLNAVNMVSLVEAIA